jgi:tetratricopeptide (TPR) repeat protein
MFEEAIAEFNNALAINPLYSAVHSFLSLSHYRLAIQHCNRAIELGIKADGPLFDSFDQIPGRP